MLKDVRYLLDTYNIVHITGILPQEWAGIDIKELINLIQMSRFRNSPITLICDGSPIKEVKNITLTSNISLKFAGGGKLADNLIRQIINSDSSPKSICVVTEDREVQRDAKRNSCKVMTSSIFLKKISSDLSTFQQKTKPKKPNTITAFEKMQWKEIFNQEKNGMPKINQNNSTDARLNEMIREASELLKNKTDNKKQRPKGHL